MVVVLEPAVKGCGAFLAVAVKHAVGPAAEQRTDEALSLAVGLGPVGTGPKVADAHCAAGDRVDRRAVGRAVVGDQPLDGDAVTREESDRAVHEADGGGRLLVCEDFGVGQSGAVVDSDVHELPAVLVAAAMVSAGALAAEHPVAGTRDA